MLCSSTHNIYLSREEKTVQSVAGRKRESEHPRAEYRNDPQKKLTPAELGTVRVGCRLKKYGRRHHPPPWGPTPSSRRPPPPSLGQAQHLTHTGHDGPFACHNTFGASDDTELNAEQMARKTPTLSLLPMPSPPSTAPSPASPSLTGVVPATAPGSPGRPCREPRREPTCEMGGARNGAVPLRPAPFSDFPSPPMAATMSGRLTPGAATTAPVPTESRTRGREPPPGRADRSVAGGVHSEEAGVKEEGGEWCMTSSSKDE